MTSKLSPALERLVLNALERYDLNSPAHVAPQVKALSDFFISHAGQPTPWSQDSTRAAYLAYFLPLNYARLATVWAEVGRLGLEPAVREIWDVGSGAGTAHWVLEDNRSFAPRPFYCVERSPDAIALHQNLIALRPPEDEPRWQPEFTKLRRPGPGALGLFSYSLLEMADVALDLEAFDHLVIVEPSTRDGGRALMARRAQLLTAGFHVLAPCTHAADCPLLVDSKRDWCHLRVAFDPPTWWDDLESALPMTNRTLTFSYLVMSRTVTPHVQAGAARVIGDTRPENGKTRQLICRGPRREFLSWLHRNGVAPRIPQGAVIETLDDLVDVRGDELRVRAGAELNWGPLGNPSTPPAIA